MANYRQQTARKRFGITHRTSDNVLSILDLCPYSCNRLHALAHIAPDSSQQGATRGLLGRANRGEFVMHMHQLVRGAVGAAAAITCGALVASAPAAAQVNNDNVTQVRFACPGPWVGCGTGLYSKVQGSKKVEPRWVERENKIKQGAGSHHFVETKDGAQIVLKGVEWVERVRIDLGHMRYSRGILNGHKGDGSEAYYELDNGALTSVYGVSAETSEETCRKQAEPGVKCNCELATLRPLQGAIGLDEVRKKQKDIADDEKKERRDLAYDPIKVVRGPGKAAGEFALYVTDHHHGARAWLEAGRTKGTCAIQDVLPTTEKEFRAGLEARKWVRLKNQDGTDIKWEDLPETLKALPDDRYRTLAWMVRKANGFCRAFMKGGTEFAEFRWADAMRAPVIALGPKLEDALPDALKFAKSDEAADLPGWHGIQAPGFKCPADPISE
jgi:hypothetical protein